jgi:hypothetical protein
MRADWLFGAATWGVLGVLTAALPQAARAQEPPPGPPPGTTLPDPGRPPATMPGPAEPPHWFERRGTEPPPPDLAYPDAHFQAFGPESLGNLYVNFDGGAHKEFGFRERPGLGFEASGQLYLARPSPVRTYSLLGGLREEVLEGGASRLSWTVGLLADVDRWQFAFGIDGIADDRPNTHVGGGFLLISRELEEWNSRIGLWTTFSLWDETTVRWQELTPFLVQATISGVEFVEHTSLFYSARLGPDGRFGEAYIAPGIEHNHSHFRLSAGYQLAIVEHVSGFVHGHWTADEDRDWSVFAGVQVHFGCAATKPFDFTMPSRIRARQAAGSRNYLFFVD